MVYELFWLFRRLHWNIKQHAQHIESGDSAVLEPLLDSLAQQLERSFATYKAAS